MRNIVVNGRGITLAAHPRLTYEQLASLAGFDSKLVLTITWCVKGGDGGELTPGDSINAIEGMIFSVADTNRA